MSILVNIFKFSGNLKFQISVIFKLLWNQTVGSNHSVRRRIWQPQLNTDTELILFQTTEKKL